MLSITGPDHFEFEERLKGFLHDVQKLQNEHYAKHYPNLSVPQVGIDRGQKYIRVKLTDSSSTRAYCFVDLQGRVLKAAGWKAPAKDNPRSNIFDADFGMSGVDWHGAVYLR